MLSINDKLVRTFRALDPKGTFSHRHPHFLSALGTVRQAVIHQLQDSLPIETHNDVLADQKSWYPADIASLQFPSGLRILLDVPLDKMNSVLRKKLLRGSAVRSSLRSENRNLFQSLIPYLSAKCLLFSVMIYTPYYTQNPLPVPGSEIIRPDGRYLSPGVEVRIWRTLTTTRCQ
ncbi:hypothetical protein CEB3_c21830 [Peptococcaceae bacterium CEB3]|nr:hypothetical protein CEB3_c21830 [Peptococcaceae bacterium CEB3]